MATKQTLKAGKPAVKASKPIKKAAVRETSAKKPISSEAKKGEIKQGKQQAMQLKKTIEVPKKVAKASNQVTKVATTIADVAKTVIKKTQELVKKSPAKDKKEIEIVAPTVKKTTLSEKKAAKVASAEKQAPPEPAKTEIKTVKQVVVPSKPLANPKPVIEKRAEGVKNDKPVVIPKTSTDKKVDYEPDFTKSVLDAPAANPQGPTMRYSDGELQEFRDLINKKLEAAKKELAYLQGLITRRDEMGGDETDNRYMTMEDGGMSMEREQLSQMASRQITFIDHLEKALMRIENKTYGICRLTGKLIDKARLRAVPHATLSMEAKLGITK
jgi:RNA polymerase-binding transcription factor DksA